MAEELKRRNEAGFGELVQSKTSFTVATDFSEIVNDVILNDGLVYSDFLPKVSTVGVSETIETSLGADDRLSANFTTICQSGNVGMGHVTFGWRRPFLFGASMDAGFGFGSRKFLSMALMNQLDKHTTGSVQLVAGLRGGTLFPQINASVSRILHPSLVGSVQLSQALGGTGQFSVSLSTKTSAEVKSPLTFTVTVPTSGDLGSMASFEGKKVFSLDSKHELRVKLGFSEQGGSGSGGCYWDCGIHRRWSDKTRGSATLQLDQNIGATLRLGLTHKSLHFIVPMRFSEEFSPASIIVASLVPTLGDYIARNFVYPILVKQRRERYWREYRAKRAAKLEKKREEAELACELMRENLSKRPLGELRILEAHYRSIATPSLSWPVSVPLQFLLNSSDTLIRLDPAYRANVLGFFDVAPGEAKETFIRYEFRGRLHEAIVPDTIELLIPQKSHLIRQEEE